MSSFILRFGGRAAVPAGRQVSGSQWDAETSLPSVSEGSA